MKSIETQLRSQVWALASDPLLMTMMMTMHGGGHDRAMSFAAMPMLAVI